ncbi:MAG: hypothetical protein AAF704_14930 [Cyanobacteria bacterium P01_D01_bin.123]
MKLEGKLVETFATKAAYYRLGLKLSTHTIAEVIAWADAEIDLQADSPIDLLELAVMQNARPLDVASQLGRMCGRVSPLEVVTAVLARAHELLTAHPSFGPTLARGIYQLYAEYSDEIPNDLSSMCSFEGLYALARAEIYGTVEALDRELLEFTAQFQDARNFSAES